MASRYLILSFSQAISSVETLRPIGDHQALNSHGRPRLIESTLADIRLAPQRACQVLLPEGRTRKAEQCPVAMLRVGGYLTASFPPKDANATTKSLAVASAAGAKADQHVPTMVEH
jgi:hypothetical protein